MILFLVAVKFTNCVSFSCGGIEEFCAWIKDEVVTCHNNISNPWSIPGGGHS